MSRLETRVACLEGQSYQRELIVYDLFDGDNPDTTKEEAWRRYISGGGRQPQENILFVSIRRFSKRRS